MPRIALTARNVLTVEARSGRDGPDYWWDSSPGAPPAFGVRVTRDGVRTYVVDYRVNGRTRRQTLGRADVLLLSHARELARDALRRVAVGEDPQAEKTANREVSSFADLVERFIDATGVTKAAKTVHEYRRILAAEIKATDLGRRPATDVRRPDVRQFLEAIAERPSKRAPAGRKRSGAGCAVLANRVYQLLRAAFAWGVREELVGSNACEGLGRPRKERSRDRVLSETELHTLLSALQGLPRVVASAVRLMLLLGTRRTETLIMRWAELNLAAGVWEIPGEARKGGEGLMVPLSSHAVRVLGDLSPVTGRGPYVFGGRLGASIAANPGRIGGLLWKAVQDAAKAERRKVDRFTLHDLRRTCATGCAELGAPPHVVALILGHKTMPGAGRVTAVYDRSKRVREVAPWLNAWAAYIDKIATGQESRADVVPLARA